MFQVLEYEKGNYPFQIHAIFLVEMPHHRELPLKVTYSFTLTGGGIFCRMYMGEIK